MQTAAVVFALNVICLAAQASEPKVVSVLPAAALIPANTLRWYVVFDRPARGWVRQSEVGLSRIDGSSVDRAFMNLGQELWSSDGKRLTILIDPGRVKRDVSAPGDTSAPLQAGTTYQISVGNFSQRFSVSPALRTALHPGAWTVTPPNPADRAVTVRFDRVMDTPLAVGQIEITGPDGCAVAGVVTLDKSGTVWRLVPTAVLPAGDYHVVAGSMLEDVSGNRIAEAFDHELGHQRTDGLYAIPFRVSKLPKRAAVKIRKPP